MNNQQSPAQTAFTGISGEQLAKIIYEEFSKTGFQFNSINAMIPAVISRVLVENGAMAGSYYAEMLLKGMMGSFFKR